LSLLGKGIHKQPHEIGYAGTKDKCAWTCQRISIFNPDLELLGKFSAAGMILRNFKWIKHKIKVGDLKANRFRITLRDADKDAIKILNRARNSEYLPNYFGAQRFGSLRKDNVQIGKSILKQRFEEAVFAFLAGFGQEESEEIKIAKKKLKSEKNILNARDYFPRSLSTEHRMLDYLADNPGDWLNALLIIGEKSLLMMVQSVQSQVFNEILEQAIHEGINLNKQELTLIGYDSRFSSGRIGEIEEEVLKSHGLDIKDFKVLKLPFLSLKSSVRKAFFKVADLNIETQDDELFSGGKKIILSFTLDSGTYATTFLDQFFILRQE